MHPNSRKCCTLSCFLMQFFFSEILGSSAELVLETCVLYGQIRKDELSVVFTEECMG